MSPLTVQISPVADVATLGETWRALEQRADRSFFLSWTWIGSWLETFAERPWLIDIRDASGRVVGLGIFCEHRETRAKVIRARQLRLHETGNPDHDVITVEYNTLLTEPGMEQAVWFAAISALQGAGAPGWDEVIIGGGSSASEALFSQLGLTLRRRAEAGSAFVDLAALREAGVEDAEGYVATLGKSTRGQIRRSMKLYRERGPLSFDVATSLDDAQRFLAELAPLHEAKWNAAGKRGATQKADYMRFHRHMMQRACSDETDNGIEVLRARAGDDAIGYVYNFVDRGTVYFYLSGFAFEEDNRLKPGLVTHTLAIEHHLKNGMLSYDFMGGDNRYKTSMGQPGPDIVSYALQRRTMPMILEGGLRGLKARLRPD
jgi:CelD/BcsL family acetyltransferase involved in cellulose biosynthesis